MKYLKLFENFKHRKPKMITPQEYQQKFDTHGTEPFSQEEYDFFTKLIEENEGWIYDFDLGALGKSHLAFMQLYPTGDDNPYLLNIDITKLKDNWYLIDEPGSDKFICDEWDEVLGYLGTQTLLKF